MPSHDGEARGDSVSDERPGRVRRVGGVQTNVCSGLFCGSEPGSSLLRNESAPGKKKDGPRDADAHVGKDHLNEHVHV